MSLRRKTLVRYLLNECDQKDKKKVTQQIQKDPVFHRELSKFQKILTIKSQNLDITDPETKWKEISRDIDKLSSEEAKPDNAENRFTHVSLHHHSSRPIFFLRLAAMLLISAVLGYFAKTYIADNWQTQSGIDYKVIKVGYGERYKVSLHDGTTIFLDSGSELKYPTEFTAKRDVFLKGEAYFEVAPDRNRPFQVHAGPALVHVLGTKFNVRYWEKSDQVIVTVREGRVAFNTDSEAYEKRIVLNQAQQASMGIDGSTRHPQSVDPEKYLGWMHNEIHFDNATVAEVLDQLERWYNYEFSVKDSSIENQNLTVHIQKTTVNDVIELIGIITKTDVIRDGRNIMFVK